MTGRVEAVCVGRATPLVAGDRTVQSAIVKVPVDGPVLLDDHRVAGDVQADEDHHGGPWQAVYAYAAEDTAWWRDRLGRDDLGPGTWGENLTLSGVEVSHAVIGSRWQIGTAVLRVTGPRIPCFKLAARMGNPRFATTFAEARRTGAYLAIDQPGEVAAGDLVTVQAVPDHGVTVAFVSDAWHRLGPDDAAERQSTLQRILDLPDPNPAVQRWAGRELAHLG